VWTNRSDFQDFRSIFGMAVVLRSKTDLVYLPDHGFVGEEGGKRLPILP
jgi:hypothetical protein